MQFVSQIWQKAKTEAKAFWSQWVAHFGTRKTITTNQGSQFESAQFKELAQLMGSEHIDTTASHPQSIEFFEDIDKNVDSAVFEI